MSGLNNLFAKQARVKPPLVRIQYSPPLWKVTLIGKRLVLKTSVGLKADGGSSPSPSLLYARGANGQQQPSKLWKWVRIPTRSPRVLTLSRINQKAKI